MKHALLLLLYSRQSHLQCGYRSQMQATATVRFTIATVSNYNNNLCIVQSSKVVHRSVTVTLHREMERNASTGIRIDAYDYLAAQRAKTAFA